MLKKYKKYKIKNILASSSIIHHQADHGTISCTFVYRPLEQFRGVFPIVNRASSHVFPAPGMAQEEKKMHLLELGQPGANQVSELQTHTALPKLVTTTLWPHVQVHNNTLPQGGWTVLHLTVTYNPSHTGPHPHCNTPQLSSLGHDVDE